MKRLEEIALFTPDVAAAARFYQHVLGIDPVDVHGGDSATFLVDGVKLFLHRTTGRPPEPDWPPGVDHLAFAVDDVDREVAALRAAGWVVEIGPRDFYWGRSAYLRDPDGRLVELHQTPPPPGREGRA